MTPQHAPAGAPLLFVGLPWGIELFSHFATSPFDPRDSASVPAKVDLPGSEEVLRLRLDLSHVLSPRTSTLTRQVPFRVRLTTLVESCAKIAS